MKRVLRADYPNDSDVAAWRPLDGCQVLIVDASDDVRQVLRTVLERRGVRILEAGQAKQGLAMAQACHPDLIVLDTDLDDRLPNTVSTWEQSYARQSAEDASALVLLGKVRAPQAKGAQRCFAKPYHYASLVRTIEELLGDGGAASNVATR